MDETIIEFKKKFVRRSDSLDDQKEIVEANVSDLKKLLIHQNFIWLLLAPIFITSYFLFREKVYSSHVNTYTEIGKWFIAYMAMMGVSCLFTNFLLMYFVIKFVNERRNILLYLMYEHLFSIYLTIGNMFPYIMIKYLVPENITKILCVFDILIPFSLYHLVTEIIIDATNYRTVYYNFRDAIEASRKNMSVIKKLQVVANDHGKMSALEIFNLLSQNKDFITVEEARAFMDVYTDQFILLFDLNTDSLISRDEFCEVYDGMVNEENFIKRRLYSSYKCIIKLKYILYFVFLPIILFPVLNTLSPELSLKGISFLSLDIFVSFGVIFTAFFSDFFQNSFYIVFVRPFEIGDDLIINGKLLQVVDIGLLYTNFESDSVVVSISNTQIRADSIENLRRSTHKTQTYNMVLNYEKFKKEKPVIKSNIQQFLAKSPRMYEQKFSVSNYDIRNDGSMEVKVKIVVKKPYCEFEQVESAIDKFAVFLYDQQNRLNGVGV